MKHSMIFGIFTLFYSCSMAQSDFAVTQTGSNNHELTYSVQYEKDFYTLLLREDTSTSEIIIILNKSDKEILSQRVPAGQSLAVRPFTRDKQKVLFIEIGSNVLYAHQLIFNRDVSFRKGLPLKGKTLNDYYNKFEKKENAVRY